MYMISSILIFSYTKCTFSISDYNIMPIFLSTIFFFPRIRPKERKLSKAVISKFGGHIQQRGYGFWCKLETFFYKHQSSPFGRSVDYQPNNTKHKYHGVTLFLFKNVYQLHGNISLSYSYSVAATKIHIPTPLDAKIGNLFNCAPVKEYASGFFTSTHRVPLV